MAAARLLSQNSDKLIAVIGDEDTVTGFLLAGIGDKSVNKETKTEQIEEEFNRLTSRDDIAILLINQKIANEVRHLISLYSKPIPTILEIPSKDSPYDPSKDSIMKRVSGMLGGES